VVLLNAVIGTVQEPRAQRSAQALRRVVVASARGVREGGVAWVPVLTKEGLPVGGSRQERINEGLSRILEMAGEDSLLYLSGPPAMVDAFHQTLLGQFLVEESRIRSEMFYGYLSR
jgi:hypothetical protein